MEHGRDTHVSRPRYAGIIYKMVLEEHRTHGKTNTLHIDYQQFLSSHSVAKIAVLLFHKNIAEKQSAECWAVLKKIYKFAMF